MIWVNSFWSFAFGASWRATVLILAGWALGYILRSKSAAARGLVWTSVIAGLLALPAMQLIPSTASIPPMPIASAYLGSGIANIAKANQHWAADAFYVWAVGASLLLLRLLGGVVGSFWLASRAVPMRVPGHEQYETLEHSGVRVAMTIGIFHGRIVFPCEARGWPDERVTLTVTHEMAHIRRYDCLFNLLSEIVCSLYWFHPLVWMTARRRRLDAEKACDDEVIKSGANPTEYADHLLSVARSVKARQLVGLVSAAMTGTSGLEQRLVAILDHRRDRRGLNRAGTVGAAAAAMFCVALLISVKPTMAQNPDDSHAYRIGEKGVTSPKVRYKVEPQYTQDARDSHIEGTVSIELEIDSGGRPRRVEVKRGLDAGLDQNAVRAIQQWRFEPGQKDGKPVSVAATIEVNFRLQ